MLTIGSPFPNFSLTGVVSTKMEDAFITISNQNLLGKWQVYFFWPKDFTFVCPTEITAFNNLHGEFKERDAELFGISTDSEFVHLAWKQQNPQLGAVTFPMLSDITRSLSTSLGILNEQSGVANRAVFIVDPEQTIRFVMVTDEKVGRNPNEVLRVLDALQTEDLCPCNWQKGNETLTAA